MLRFEKSLVLAAVTAALTLAGTRTGVAAIAANALSEPDGASGSYALAVNASGKIVGYIVDADFNELPCVWENGTRSMLTMPTGFDYGEAGGVNARGEIFDVYAHSADWSLEHPVAWLINPNTSALEPVDLGLPEGETRGWCTAISDTGQVGCNMDNSKGYLAEVAWDTGSPVVTWTALQLDDGTPFFAEVIRTAETPDGQVTRIAGVTLNPDSYMNSGAVFWQRIADATPTAQLITPPGSDWASDVTMNSSGKIAGGHRDIYNSYAYTWDSTAGFHDLSLNLHDDGTLNAASAKINDNGQILVMTEDASLADRAWLVDSEIWTEIPVGDLVPPESTDRALEATLNNNGQVAGFVWGHYDSPGYYSSVAFVWDNVIGFRTLGNLGNKAEPWVINDAGLIAGDSETAPGGYPPHACYWSARLNSPPVLNVPSTVSVALGNAATFTATATDPDEGETFTFSLVDDIYGASINPSTGAFTWPTVEPGNFAFTVAVADSGGLSDTKQVVVSVWPAGDGTPTDLGVLPGFDNSVAADVNNGGMVVGTCFNMGEVCDPDGCETQPTSMKAFVWVNGAMTELPSLPGYDFCQAVAVNANGLIVGEANTAMSSGTSEVCIWEFVDNAWTVHGLGHLDLPDHSASYLGYENRSPINDAGQIVGISYYLAESGETMGECGFIWQNGAMAPLEDTSVDPPTPIYPYGINAGGQVMGQAPYQDPYMYGPEVVLWQDSTTIRLAPNRTAEPFAFNNNGQVTGSLWDTGTFLWLPTAVGTPGTPSYWDAGLNDLFWLDYASVPAINDAGQFLVSTGHYGVGRPMEEVGHLAMMYLSGARTDLGDTPPGQVGQVSMNDFGQVAGSCGQPVFTPDGSFLYFVEYGYYAGPGIGTEGNRVFLLGGLGGLETYANAINLGGSIVGDSLLPDNKTTHACIWLAPQPENQPPVLSVPAMVNGAVGFPVTFQATAFDVDAGDTLTFSLYPPDPEAFIDPSTGVFTWVPMGAGGYYTEVRVDDGNGHICSQVVNFTIWPSGTPVPADLALPRGFENSTAVAMNNNGQVIGESFHMVYDEYSQYWDVRRVRACVWESGAPAILPLLPNDAPYYASFAVDINDSGQIAGYCTDYYDEFPQACLWEKDTDGKWTVTGLGFFNGETQSKSLSINASGQVLVTSGFFGNSSFLWHDGAQQPYSLPTGYDTIDASAMNDSGVVVGRLFDTVGGQSGAMVVWDSSSQTLTKEFDGSVFELFAINNSGWVIGEKYDSMMDEYHGFVWNPDTDTLTNLPFPPSELPNPIDPQTSAGAINDDGTVLATYYAQFDPDGVPGNGDDYFAVEFWAWKDGVYTGPIKSFVSPDMGGGFINSAGQVAGWADSQANPGSAFFWNGSGQAVDLPGLGGDRIVVGFDEALAALDNVFYTSNPRAMNSNGEIAGTSTLIPVQEDPSIEMLRHAAVWKTPSNQKPTLDISTAPTTGMKGTPYAFTASATDPDAGDTLTFSLEGVTNGASIDPSSGVFSWTPSATGTFSFTVKVADVAGAFDTKSFSVEVSRAPSALTFSNVTATRKGKTVSVTIKTTVTNPTSTPALNAQLNDATLGTITTATALPLRIGTIRPRTSKTITMLFRNAPAGQATLTVEGTCSIGGVTKEFYTSQDVVVP